MKKIGEFQQETESISAPASVKPQSVKLQKYTITLFKRDYKDLIHFRNQFLAEVDGSAIAKISKFNYLLELVKEKSRENILGLLHTEDGYDEERKRLNDIYSKDIKFHKQLIKEIKSLLSITSTNKYTSFTTN